MHSYVSLPEGNAKVVVYLMFICFFSWSGFVFGCGTLWESKYHNGKSLVRNCRSFFPAKTRRSNHKFVSSNFSQRILHQSELWAIFGYPNPHQALRAQIEARRLHQPRLVPWLMKPCVFPDFLVEESIGKC